MRNATKIPTAMSTFNWHSYTELQYRRNPGTGRPLTPTLRATTRVSNSPSSMQANGVRPVPAASALGATGDRQAVVRFAERSLDRGARQSREDHVEFTARDRVQNRAIARSLLVSRSSPSCEPSRFGPLNGR